MSHPVSPHDDALHLIGGQAHDEANSLSLRYQHIYIYIPVRAPFSIHYLIIVTAGGSQWTELIDQVDGSEDPKGRSRRAPRSGVTSQWI